MKGDQRIDLRGLKLGWHEGRTDRLFAQVQRRIGRRKRIERVVLSSATLVLSLCIALVAVRFRRGPKITSSASDSALRLASRGAIYLHDGSLIKLDPSKSEVRVESESATRVGVEQVRGSALYSVAPNPERLFEVHSGSVTVTVVGTEFVVERRGESSWVEVRRGKVRVSWGEGTEQALLTVGDSGLFPRPATQMAAEGAAIARERDASQTVVARAERATLAYRAHLAHHDYRGAYAVLSQNPTLAGDSVSELLLAADVARLSDHPSQAIPYLQRVVGEHAQDERAPLAAFTLGRTLSRLGRTREAMNVFGRVRSGWPKSPLGEDALLRQVEAAARLGDFASAARLAEQYDRDYPNGRRRTEVRRYARLE